MGHTLALEHPEGHELILYMCDTTDVASVNLLRPQHMHITMC